jgi:hypothetical protein
MTMRRNHNRRDFLKRVLVAGSLFGLAGRVFGGDVSIEQEIGNRTNFWRNLAQVHTLMFDEKKKEYSFKELLHDENRENCFYLYDDDTVEELRFDEELGIYVFNGGTERRRKIKAGENLSKGLGKIKISRELSLEAKKRAEDMSSENKLSHESAITPEIISHVNHPSYRIVDDHMATYYHRLPLVMFGLTEIGVGIATDKINRGHVYTAINFDLVKARSSYRGFHVVSLPGDNQIEVPTSFYEGGENPNPMPEDTDRRAGFPITVCFNSQNGMGRKIENLIWTVNGESGYKEKIWIPERRFSIGGEDLGVMTQSPTLEGTEYEVAIRADVYYVKGPVKKNFDGRWMKDGKLVEPFKYAYRFKFKTMGTRLEKPLGNLKPGYSRGK